MVVLGHINVNQRLSDDRTTGRPDDRTTGRPDDRTVPETGFHEPFPTIVAPQPGGLFDPLGESVLDLDQPWLRVFEPRDVRLVLGRNQDPHRELIVAQAQADDVPIHRRVAGGGAVV